MTRIALVVVLCALGTLGVAKPASSQTAGNRAQLQITDLHPLTVRGAGFAANERVSVLATASGGLYAKTKVANAAGVFTMRFSISLGLCRGYYAIRAFGSRGSRARAFLVFPQRGCPDPDTG
jgi:hypothetical protein